MGSIQWELTQLPLGYTYHLLNSSQIYTKGELFGLLPAGSASGGRLAFFRTPRSSGYESSYGQQSHNAFIVANETFVRVDQLDYIN